MDGSFVIVLFNSSTLQNVKTLPKSLFSTCSNMFSGKTYSKKKKILRSKGFAEQTGKRFCINTQSAITLETANIFF